MLQTYHYSSRFTQYDLIAESDATDQSHTISHSEASIKKIISFITTLFYLRTLLSRMNSLRTLMIRAWQKVARGNVPISREETEKKEILHRARCTLIPSPNIPARIERSRLVSLEIRGCLSTIKSGIPAPRVLYYFWWRGWGLARSGRAIDTPSFRRSRSFTIG
jgi:hypothetical protein